MPHDDVRAAARERDRGMRRIGQITIIVPAKPSKLSGGVGQAVSGRS